MIWERVQKVSTSHDGHVQDVLRLETAADQTLKLLIGHALWTIEKLVVPLSIRPLTLLRLSGAQDQG